MKDFNHKTPLWTLFGLLVFGSCQVRQLEPALSTPTDELNCVVTDDNNVPVSENNDMLVRAFSSLTSCPTNVLQLKDILQQQGPIRSSMVANRGRNNPARGSFSFFEWIDAPSKPAELFLGHFTAKQNNEIILDQSPRRGKLLVELMAWDSTKGYYNFYEMMGTNSSAEWKYRGDSKDAFLDNQELHRQSPPRFGRRMRCSGCHTSGGPIMKEFSAPHNDWWTNLRSLPFGGATLSNQVSQAVNSLRDASEFSTSVQAGINRLEASPGYLDLKRSLSLQEQLRPLFCTVEVNLASDTQALDSLSQTVTIPSSSLVHPRLALGTTALAKADYLNLMRQSGLRFPENGSADADHAWLAPVPSVQDLLAIDSLISQGIVDDEFVADVLAVDMKAPTFSKRRCKLLKHIENGNNWKEELLTSLSNSSEEAEQELLRNLTEPERNEIFHKRNARSLLESYNQQILDGEIEPLFQQLLQSRRDIFQSDISKNPLGQILEPGFRVIFPSR